MRLINCAKGFVLLAALGATCLALADNDDDNRASNHEQERAGRRNLVAVTNPTYKAECSSCHMLYPPGLLPARSWQAMMGGLKDHFGENATVDKATKEVLTQFLTANAADRATARRSQKIAKTISSKDTPLRFTETLYFKRQHHEIGSKIWQRKSVRSPANCVACHSQAEAGDFSEESVRIPR